MRALRIAFAACALTAAPLAISAQTSPPSHIHYPVRPHPRPTSNHPGYPHGRLNHPGYPHVLIDGSVVNRYLYTPAPKPRVTRKPETADRRFGQQTFETHATDVNR